MKVVGLITEYNPFHYGHQLHLNLSKKKTGSDFCVAVMSGNYVQRGEPACIDKWSRTEAALKSGIDMVIELPVHFATSSAEFFASAAVALLEGTGIVNSICFGSELGKIEPLDQLASFLVNEPKDYQNILMNQLGNGVSYPTARSLALEEYLSKEDAEILNSSNNILGVEYLKAIKRQNSSITPFTIQRVGSAYHDQSLNHNIVSASAIRKYLDVSKTYDQLEQYVPATSHMMLQKCLSNQTAPVTLEDFFVMLKYQLSVTSPEHLSSIVDISEGLDNRILSTLPDVSSMSQLIEKVSTKRFTITRIQRSILHILLNIHQSTFQAFIQTGFAQYIKVLGFRANSRILMKQLKQNAKLPIIVNVKDSEKQLTSLQLKMLQDEILSSNIYNIALLNKLGTNIGNDYTNPIIIL